MVVGRGGEGEQGWVVVGGGGWWWWRVVVGMVVVEVLVSPSTVQPHVERAFLCSFPVLSLLLVS